ncbi:CMP-N,N'-diacetyllegionaminic acid synthase [Sediminibacterium sp. KACHI17]|uniref:CMP-N,N'-diacetyllegionaminic acid synthase n=1 Tax=Sediminibacterium sp. KACHI17 TaxID=1751071 RepID=A0AAT9GI83_9BACT
MKILISICARGGSKGIPGKNIKNINGKALIAYTIEHARAFATLYDCDIALSTDSDEIKSTCASFGLTTSYMRPENISSDSAGKMETIKHLLLHEENVRGVKYDYILDLDVSSPLRNLKDLQEAFNAIQSDNEALNLFSVNKANRNPYFNMVEQQVNGYYSLVKKGDSVTRQSAPVVYDMNASFYFFRRVFFDVPEPKTISERAMVYIMPHICFDLDHPIDFDVMEYLMINNKLDFEL